MGVSKVSALREIRPFEGVSLRVLAGARGMLSFVYFEPDGVVPPHSHPHEQMGVALEGSFELTIGDETRVVQEGDIWHILPNVVHSARALGEKSGGAGYFCAAAGGLRCPGEAVKPLCSQIACPRENGVIPAQAGILDRSQRSCRLN